MTSLESSGLNAGYVGQLLEQYLENPEAVDPAWRALFEEGDGDLLSALPGLERFRAEMVSGGLRVVVTSHVWVDGTKPAPEGCGCQGGAGSNGVVTALALTALARRRRRARRP